MNSTERKASLEARLSKIAGVKIEITVRDLRNFTLSFEGNNPRALQKVRSFFAFADQIAKWEEKYDSECDMTFVWFDVK